MNYITLEDFKAWASLRGFELFDYIDSDINAAIHIATDYVDMNYTFKGEKVSEAQLMQLPTDEVAIADIHKAMGEAVKMQLLGRLYVDPTTISQKGAVVSESKAVGSLSTSTDYAEGYAYTNTYPTTRISTALRPFTVAGGLGTVVRG